MPNPLDSAYQTSGTYHAHANQDRQHHMAAPTYSDIPNIDLDNDSRHDYLFPSQALRTYMAGLGDDDEGEDAPKPE